MPLRYKDFGDNIQNGASYLGGSRLQEPVKFRQMVPVYSVTWEMKEG